MPVYAIGDIQGCHTQLQALLNKVRFDPAQDRLWFVGDLVNRGPDSLEVLRLVRGLGDAAITVLGNHDLHLLALASGRDRRKSKDTLDAIFTAPDRDELLHWLRHRPLLHYDASLNTLLVHAGLLPQWDIALATRLAREVEAILQAEEHPELFANMYGNEPDQWREDLSGWERIRVAINAFTRLRYCDAQGRMDFISKGPPALEPPPRLPWYQVPERRSQDQRIVFGHWSALGYLDAHNVLALDTGCIWGGALTAVRIDHPRPQPVRVSCPGNPE